MTLLITNGKPHDIDVFQSEILVQDAGRAIYTTGTHEQSERSYGYAATCHKHANRKDALFDLHVDGLFQ
jgi:hypothetical protein